MPKRSPTLAEWLKEEPFELSLCAGYFAFFAHTGFAKALEEKQLRPLHYYGTSAGAIVSALLAHGMNTSEIEKAVLSIKKESFWDPGFGFGILKGQKYHSILQQFLPSRFEDLKMPLHMAAFELKSLKPRIFKSGDLVTAIRASSAFPGLFHPVKVAGTHYLDGGLGDELALAEKTSSHRLLVHYIDDIAMPNKAKRRLRKMSYETQVIQFSNLLQSGPKKLHLGPQIIEQTYRQTKDLLEKPIAV